MLAVLANLALQAGFVLGGGPSAPAAPARIRCTPATVAVPGRGVVSTEHPIARALEAAGPGTVIDLDPGDYEPFTIGMGSGAANDAATSGGARGAPVVVDGHGAARIVGRTDAIAIDQRRANRFVTFRDLVIVCGQRSGVIFYRQSGGRAHVGYSFEDCEVRGGFDHRTGRGRHSKWGISGHSLAEFRFVGVRAPARIGGIEKEHAFYLQNPRGSILLENIQASGIGRTFCQFTARAAEGPPGKGQLTIRNCSVGDCGLAAGDDYKGGSAFTFAGRLEGVILLEDNVYRAGERRDFLHLTKRGEPYGTGALVAWAEGSGARNGTLVLRDNRFLFAEGCGDRPVVSIGGCEKVRIVGENVFRSGGRWPALALDPVRETGELVSPPNGPVELSAATRLEAPAGRIPEALLEVRGEATTPERFRAARARRR